MGGLETFLAMGGYGGYVWSAYAIAAVVLVANIIAARRDERAASGALSRASTTRRPADDAAP
jgi:heme exporter protein D